jgi:GAF domain-containing protein
MTREALLVRTFVELTDNLVEDFDVVDLLTMLADRCVEVLDVTAAGLMVAGASGELRVVASSSDTMRMLELFELQSGEGPCLDCYHSGRSIVNAVLADHTAPWPRFASLAMDAGFVSVVAIPMHMRDLTIGALNLFRKKSGELHADDVIAAQALADVATIAILHQQAAVEAQAVNEQLGHALHSRVVIEQAKGMVAERTGLDMDESFERLRRHARNHNMLLAEVARLVTVGSLQASQLDPMQR